MAEALTLSPTVTQGLYYPLADLEWKALPFSLTQTGALDRNKHTATATGSLDLYFATAAEYGFCKVSFRVPGANTGTP